MARVRVRVRVRVSFGNENSYIVLYMLIQLQSFLTPLKTPTLYSGPETHVPTGFLPARRYASAGLCDSDVSACLSVCHTPVLCLAERKQDREMYTTV